jgi:tetratricopeptide (TPR) repeat protein
MNAADKDYREGLKEKYIHGWGSDYPYPHFVKAEKDLLAALAETQTFSAKDLRIPQTQDTLADVYRQEGKYSDAENQGKQAVSAIEASLGPDDPRLYHVLITLGLVYAVQDKSKEAAPLFDHSLAIFKRTGKADPELVSVSKQELSFNEKLRSNRQVARFLVELEESTGAPDKDVRLALEHMLTDDSGPGAEQDFAQLLEVDKRLYPPDGEEVNGDQESLAKLYVDEGKYATALPILVHSLQVRQTKAAPHESRFFKGSYTLEMQRFYREMAEAYLATGKDSEAEEMYKRVISMDESTDDRHRGLNERGMIDDLRGLSRVYCAEHRYDEAVETEKRSVRAADQISGTKTEESIAARLGGSIWVWMSQNDLAEIYREKGDAAAAEPLFQNSLEMAQTLQLAPGHPELARLLENYANLLRDQGKNAEAEANYKRSLETSAKWRYPELPETAATLTNYAVLLRKVDRPDEAATLEARASAIREKLGATAPLK